MNNLLVISYRFPPETYPLSIRVEYFLDHLRKNGWAIDTITAADSDWCPLGVTVHHVPPRSPDSLFGLIRKLRLGKILDTLVWPDPFVFWVLPALRTARKIIDEQKPDAIAVFMMPYSQGLVGMQLKRETGLPLILNLNDSPTCSDMNPSYPSQLHYWFAHKLEDWYVQSADAVVYVSRRNMERVRNRHPSEHQDKFHLIRRGTQPLPNPERHNGHEDHFRIVYTGGTSGWYEFLEDRRPPTLLKRMYRAWKRLGRHQVAALDHRTHSPIYVGRAVKQVVDRHPEWKRGIQVDVFGEKYPDPVVNAVLDKFELHEVVNLHGRVPHQEALQRMVESDVLFMALPNRVDGSPGGRISAKTYEYLMTDRPILAALPPGENREYLQDKPGVYLTEPDGVEEMADVIDTLASATFEGHPVRVDRSDLRLHLSSTARARAFEEILERVTETRATSNGVVDNG
jgi:glycosyltransferase involved in cell wall biosynthesis